MKPSKGYTDLAYLRQAALKGLPSVPKAASLMSDCGLWPFGQRLSTGESEQSQRPRAPRAVVCLESSGKSKLEETQE
jgi:hypothetical protein